MRPLALALACTLLAAPAAAGEIAVVRSSDLPALRTVEAVFAEKAGKVRSLSLSEPGAEEALPALLAGAPLILVLGPEAARAVAAHSPSAPVLMAMVLNPERTGLAAPAIPARVSAAAQVRLIKQVLPAQRRLGLLFDPALSAAAVAEYEAAAHKAGLVVEKEEVHSRDDVATAARALLPRVDALWLIPDATVITPDAFKFLVRTSVSAKVPLIGFSEGMARAGTVLAIEASPAEIGRHAAEAAQRMLAGRPAAPESPAGAVFLNAKSAELLGIELTPEALELADRPR